MADFADVILPLPLAEAFTYALPAPLKQKVQVGCRLVVPFGPKKMYAGFVTRLSDSGPAQGIRVKEAIDLLDEAPVLLPLQLRLWAWIADYYLCSIGEVCKAALPAGLKLESETVVCLNAEGDFTQTLSAYEERTLGILRETERMRVADLQKHVGQNGAIRLVKALLDKGLVSVYEEMRGQRQARKLTAYVRLAPRLCSQESISECLANLERSPRQRELLTSYLSLSKADEALRLGNPALLAPVERSALLPAGSPLTSAFAPLRAKEVFETYMQEALPSRAEAGPKAFAPLPLSADQLRAKAEIEKAFEERDVCLLHGVTGSGKTEVYIHLISQTIERGGQVLYLLPEIVLTAQLVDRLRRVFGSRLGVYHSKYSDADRTALWRKQLSPVPYDIIVGVRSSVFLPFRNLRLVVIDEEHETSFKQQEPAPRYHARNTALVLAQMSGAKAVLGTATPSLESYHNAQTGKYRLVTLAERYSRVEMPEIVVADTADLRKRKMMKGHLSPRLFDAITTALSRGEQAILFRNRRGFAPVVECHDCGWTPRCQQCDVPLTFHKSGARMVCHYCGASYPVPSLCPACAKPSLTAMGYGTERIEEEMQALFPSARIARMDQDTTRTRRAYEQIIDNFQRGRTDILIGTQMVAKGLDIERVSVVGILSADAMLALPDFRATERAFHMMAQVAGRAGRRKAQGLVVLQTSDPSASIIAQVRANDYEAMYREQLQEREAFAYPPFTRLVCVYVKHRDPQLAQALASDLALTLKASLGQRVLGPDTPPVAMVRQQHIRKLLLKLEPSLSLQAVRRTLRQTQASLLARPHYRTAQLYYDADPY